MKNKSKSTSRKIVCLILSFLLSLLISAIFLCISAGIGICNVEIFTHNVADSTYYDTLYTRLNENLLTLLEQAEMPKSVGKDVLSQNQVYIDGRVYVNATLEGKHPEINTDDIEKKLLENINNYLDEKGIPKEKVEEGINEIVDTMVIDYRNSLSLKIVDYFYNYRQSFLSWIYKIVIGSLLGVILITVLLIGLYKRKHRSIRYISYAVLTASIVNLFYTVRAAGIVRQWEFAGNDSYYSKMVKEYLMEALNSGYYMTIAGIILFFVFLVLTKTLKKQN